MNGRIRTAREPAVAKDTTARLSSAARRGVVAISSGPSFYQCSECFIYSSIFTTAATVVVSEGAGVRMVLPATVVGVAGHEAGAQIAATCATCATKSRLTADGFAAKTVGIGATAKTRA